MTLANTGLLASVLGRGRRVGAAEGFSLVRGSGGTLPFSGAWDVVAVVFGPGVAGAPVGGLVEASVRGGGMSGEFEAEDGVG